MKINADFNGRKAGAIGVFYWIGTFDGEGVTESAAVDDARQKAYAAGFEHVHTVRVRRVDMPPHPIIVHTQTRPGACCDKATPRPCACVYSYDCPEHGKTCVGSHD